MELYSGRVLTSFAFSLYCRACAVGNHHSDSFDRNRALSNVIGEERERE